MTVKEVYEFLDEKFPFNTALQYDNPGLLVGDENAKVTGVITCLDCSDEAISKAVEIGANLMVTHHPLIFKPLSSVTADGLVYRLIRNGISLISVHTNLDVGDGGVNDCLCKTIGFENVEKIYDDEGYAFRMGELEEPMDSDSLAAMLSEKLNLRVKYVGESGFIKKVAVSTGSCGDLLDIVLKTEADAFVTADIKHNHFCDAHNEGFTLFDCGHFNTEDVVIAPLSKLLETLDLKVYDFHFSPIKYK